jgi:transposase InsO family protein
MFSCFKKVKALVEKEVIILYNHSGQIGSEFCSKDFNVFCEDHGIKRLLTVPRSP